MKQSYFVNVTETYTARIAVQASSLEEAEEIADELVGGGKVNVVNLVLAEEPYTDYSKTCEAFEM